MHFMRRLRTKARIGGVLFLVGFYAALGYPGAQPWRFPWLLYLYPAGGLVIAMLGGALAVQALESMHKASRHQADDEPIERK